MSAAVRGRRHAVRHSRGARSADLARHPPSGCRPEDPAKNASVMLLLQTALVDPLLQHGLTHLANVLQIRSLSVSSRAPVTYRPVRTNTPNQPQPSCVHAELQCDQAPRELDVDHARRAGTGRSAREAASICGCFGFRPARTDEARPLGASSSPGRDEPGQYLLGQRVRRRGLRRSSTCTSLSPSGAPETQRPASPGALRNCPPTSATPEGPH